MLTDYHTHLRPDELEFDAKNHFTGENVEVYLEAAKEHGIAELGFSEHIHRFKQALAIWDHPFWRENAVDDLDCYLQFLVEMKACGHQIKAGIEVDWIEGREEQIMEVVGSYDWDYVIGSVHFLGEYAVDNRDFDVWAKLDAQTIWGRYFDALGQAAASGLFDILAHPDLVKIWGSYPEGELEHYYQRAMEGIANADIAVELSTAGLRKPVAEIYPSERLLQLLVEAGKPVALSSDAHRPGEIGYAYEYALEALSKCGVTSISTFNQRQRMMVALDG